MIKKTLMFGNPAYLSLRNEQLVIQSPTANREKRDRYSAEVDDSMQTRPIEDIGVLILDHQQITITSALLSALVENNVAVISCNDNYMPVGLFMPLKMNTVQNERFRAQIDASLPLKKQMWQQTIQAKIANQGAVLDICREESYPCMKAWAKEVNSGDTNNLEGRAAAFYWSNLFEGVAGIKKFYRDQFGEQPNSLLNYGYAILRAVIARSLVASGLLPTLGIHHHNKYNAYCLADDIMEPYRPYVDELVFGIVKSDGLPEDEKLTTEWKRKLLSIPTLDVVIDGARSPLMIAAQQTTASVAKCFAGDARRIDYPRRT